MTPGDALGTLLQQISMMLSMVYDENDPGWAGNFDAEGAHDFIVHHIFDQLLNSESLFRLKETPGDISARLQAILDGIRDGSVDVNSEAGVDQFVFKLQSIIRDLVVFGRAHANA